ncbi:hypothetical protein [Sphingomonas sp.]|uniref:hypothetical protein n=1 Tax=Sphingomonas sp. TaxID=28214 RepID=UPI0035B3593C
MSVRVYGGAEPEDKQGTPDGGMRGEGAGGVESGLRHQIAVENGRVVEIEEASGVVFAETKGMVATPSAKRRTSVVNDWQTPAIIGLSFIAGFVFGRGRSVVSGVRGVPAAFVVDEGPVEGVVQVRGAGQDRIRDAAGDWDRVDQGSDESFPASDPPAY